MRLAYILLFVRMMCSSNRLVNLSSPNFLATDLEPARAPSIYIIPPESFGRKELKVSDTNGSS